MQSSEIEGDEDFEDGEGNLDPHPAKKKLSRRPK